MRKLIAAFSLILVSLLLMQCQKELGYIGASNPVIVPPSPITAHLQGNVFDENDQPAAGVTIKVGTNTAVTDAKGYFRIMNAALDKRASLVTAERSGYFKAYRTFAATSGTNQVEFKLIRRTLSGTIDGAAGGEISLSNGAKVQLSANGVVVAASGAAYAGPVNVYAAYIDPTSSDIDRLVPGSWLANQANGNRVLLESYGMMAVELSTPAGEKLQIKTGATSKLTVPIPSSLQSLAPANMPLWYVDEQTGIWKEEGSATKTGNAYVGDVKHYTFWNCDLPMSTTPISFTLETSTGHPLSYAYVKIVRQTQPLTGMVHGTTDSLGQASPNVPANQVLILSVHGRCGNVIYSQNIGPFAGATNLGTITVPGTPNGILTITGSLKDCNGAPVTNGYAMIVYENIVRYAALNASGEFNTAFVRCTTGPATATILGVNTTTNQQGAAQTITLTMPVTNVPAYTVCGTSSLQFVNYTLDGTSYSITGAAGDSLAARTTSLQGTTLFRTFINSSRISGQTIQQLSFWFNSPATVAGTYSMGELVANNNFIQNPSIPLNITNFATAIGEYYEGNFSGTFTDSASVNHTISCNFRIRRTQ